MYHPCKGFCLGKKKSKNPRKNSEVGGWVKPQLGFVFVFGNFVFFVLFFVVEHVSNFFLNG